MRENPGSNLSFELDDLNNPALFAQTGFNESDVWVDPDGVQLRFILTAFFVTCIMILIVVGNMLVCIAIATEKTLKTIQNWFIASLAVSDFLIGLIIMPFSLARELMGYWIFGDVWCDIHAALDVLICTASINNLCLISLDRYWSVTHAVEYLRKRTSSRALAMICFVWLLSAVISLPPLVGWKKKRGESLNGLPQCALSDDIGYVLYSALGSFYIPAVVMVFVYIRIFLAARSRARRHMKKTKKAAAAAAAAAAASRAAPNLDAAPPTNRTEQSTTTSFSAPFNASRMNGGEKVRQKLASTSDSVRPCVPPPIVIVETPEEANSVSSPPLSPDLDEDDENENYSRNGTLTIPQAQHMTQRTSNPSQNSGSGGSLAPPAQRSPYGSTLSLNEIDSDEVSCVNNPDVRSGSGALSGASVTSASGVVQRPTDAERRRRKIAKARERRATMILGLIMAAFILAWLPFFVMYVLGALCHECQIPETVFAVAFWLGYCNSAVNPIIYTIFNRDFRKAFRKILFK